MAATKNNYFSSSVFWSTEHIAYRDPATRTQTVLENFALPAIQVPDAASSPEKVSLNSVFVESSC